MKSRTWFLLSLMLFVAAAFFWKQAEERRLSSHPIGIKEKSDPLAEKSTGAPHEAGAVAKLPSSEPGEELGSTNSTNAVLYPNRLQNTSQTLEQFVRNERGILLRNALIDTGAGRLEIPDHLRSKGDPGSYIVQAKGPIDETFRAELLAAKAEVISYVPNNAYLVRLPQGGAEQLAANKSVQSLLRYEPYYKLDTELLDIAVKNKTLMLNQLLRVTLFPGQVDAAVNALKGKASIIERDLKSSPFGPELIVSTEDLVALAHLPAVQEIEPFYEREVLNDLSRERLGVTTNTLAVTPTHQDLSGVNILVNVNDTTVDVTHPDLAPRMFPYNGIPTIDPNGHGTHVAGIIASSGLNGLINGTNVPGSVDGASLRGKATNANIFSMNIFGGFADWELQEIAARTNLLVFGRESPLISNNSWGYGGNTYNSAAASYDMAVRDAIPGLSGSQPIIYVFAAGNSGGDRGNDNGQGGFPGSVTSPATAKNVISVGALENYRNITNEVIQPNRNCVVLTNAEFLGYTDSSNQVAFFSSRGNVGISVEGTYGRFKPDLVEPGTFVASTRSQQFDEAAYYSNTNVNVQVLPNLLLDPGATGRFSIFIPNSPCNQGRALSFSIETVPNPFSPKPFPPLAIYVDNQQAPSASPANLAGMNSVTISEGDPKFARGTIYYDIVNTNNIEVSYNVRTAVVSTNDVGNYFTVLKQLNSTLGTNYIFESGTSMAAPAISGMLALMQEFFEEKLTGTARRTNSPAMMKALLINTAQSAGNYDLQRDRILNHQGWGLPNLTRALPDVLATEPDPSRWPIQMFDQSPTNALATGESHVRNVTVADTNSPLRITLVWTDPPGNPTVGVKLVNDLDLVVKTISTNSATTNVTTNYYFGNSFPGGSDFCDPIEVGTNGAADFDLVRDVVNNVENVYINGPLSGSYEVSVVARRVNVNAVTAHTNGVVQDYALVISSGNLSTAAPIAVTPATPPIVVDPTNSLTFLSNGIPLFNERVGANAPLSRPNAIGLTDGKTNQWNFYVLENPDGFTNAVFVTFLPLNLSGTTNVSPNSRRNFDADIDMYVSTESGLTNLNPTALANANKSRNRGGQELVFYTNSSASVYYIGVKSEDQQAAEYSFIGVVTNGAFGSEDEDGNMTLPNLIGFAGREITDGTPEKPGGGLQFMGISIKPINVARVVVTNTMTHELFGDLLGTLTHHGSEAFAVLNNHTYPVTPGFPEGQESGTVTLAYDDSELNDLPFSRPTDGPGSLVDFVGEDGVGVWQFTMEDNSLHATGRVDELSVFLERGLETNALADGEGFIISPISIPSGQSRALSFLVPLSTTNMIISISPKEGEIDTVVRRGARSPLRNPYVNYGKLIAAPGGELIIGTTNTPPLEPGRYTLRLFNDGPSAVTVSGLVRFELDLAARSLQTYIGGSVVNILDDAVTNSIIHIDRDARVVATEVGVRIDHPRVSDLVLHLVSPQGTRILLAENRGGYLTNGYGVSQFATNSFSADSGGPDASTNTIPTTLNSGIINIDYEFFDAPDTLRVYYDNSLIFDSGSESGAGRFTVPFGPGIDTNVIIVMNQGNNSDPGTAWEYTVEVLSGSLVYATFSENTNLALVPIKFAIPPFATNLPSTNVTADTLLQNPSFEAGLAGWNANNAGVVISPFIPATVPATHGTNAVEIGINNIPGSILSQKFTAEADTSYLLSFDLFAVGDPGRTGILRVEITNASGILISQTFTNNARNTPPFSYDKKIMRFTTPLTDTNLTLRFVDLSPFNGVAVDPIVDNIQLPSQHGDPNFFLPEESLKTLIGENAQGDWKLEIWDNRVGAPVGNAQLMSWQLHFTFASTTATADPLISGVTETNVVSGSEFKYFFIDVPIFATRATNVLLSFGGPLNLWFNQEELPLGNQKLGDVVLLPTTINGTRVLTTGTLPDLQPGRRYFLGVQNSNPSQTNAFTLTVTFDNTNNLVNVTPLTNGIPLSTNLPLGQSIHYYQYDPSAAANQVLFRVLNMSDDVDLVVRQGFLPTPSNYDFNSTLGGTNAELVDVNLASIPPLVPGRYYVGVYGFFPTNAITYTVLATEFGSSAPIGEFFNSPSLMAGSVTLTAGTIPEETYELLMSTNLVNWTVVDTITATNNQTTFTDPNPPAEDTARFYQLRQFP